MSFTTGTLLKTTLFGQSHAPALGVVLDGLPAGETLDLDRLQAFVDRRAARGQSYATPRKEADRVQLISGGLPGPEGMIRTCGAPLCLMIENGDSRSGDYARLRDLPRPGHADYTAEVKYRGHQDTAGGGFFSGRMTAALCMAGGLALQVLEKRGIEVGAYIRQIGDCAGPAFPPTAEDLRPLREAWTREIPALDAESAARMRAEIKAQAARGDSVGGILSCVATGLPVGLGEPYFQSVESRLAALLYSIPAVKGLSFGLGWGFATQPGSLANDAYYQAADGRVRTRTNHNGGLNGGLTNGMPLLVDVVVKATPSIALEQESLNLRTGEVEAFRVGGRHDACIVPRALVCVEAAVALGLLDLYLIHQAR